LGWALGSRVEKQARNKPSRRSDLSGPITANFGVVGVLADVINHMPSLLSVFSRVSDLRGSLLGVLAFPKRKAGRHYNYASTTVQQPNIYLADDIKTQKHGQHVKKKTTMLFARPLELTAKNPLITSGRTHTTIGYRTNKITASSYLNYIEQ
jgi:hypothetical protein